MYCSRQGCGNAGEKRHTATTSYCRRCYRLLKILGYCRRRYPHRPTDWNELDALWTEAEDFPFCPHCSKAMIFYPPRQRRGMATIQHYDDGRLGVICLGCNLAHSKSELGDGLFALKPNEKFCPDCGEIKDRDEFHIQNRFNGRVSYCKPCQNARNRQVKQRGRERQFQSTPTPHN